MGGRQNYGPHLGPLNIWCRITLGTQKGTIILTTTYMLAFVLSRGWDWRTVKVQFPGVCSGGAGEIVFPVANVLGLLCLNPGLLEGAVACHFGLLGSPARY